MLLFYFSSPSFDLDSIHASSASALSHPVRRFEEEEEDAFFFFFQSTGLNVMDWFGLGPVLSPLPFSPFLCFLGTAFWLS
jgi:hypothetical protein